MANLANSIVRNYVVISRAPSLRDLKSALRISEVGMLSGVLPKVPSRVIFLVSSICKVLSRALLGEFWQGKQASKSEIKRKRLASGPLQLRTHTTPVKFRRDRDSDVV